MTSNEITLAFGSVLTYANVALALLVIFFNLRAMRSQAIGPGATWHLMSSLLMLYFIAVYITVITSDVYFVRSGVASRIGVTLVMVLLAYRTRRDGDC
jgi:hypothetical protein